MLMEEALNNTGWTSADVERIFLLQIHPAMCGSGFTGAHRHHHLEHLVHLAPRRRISATPPAWRSSRRRTGGCCHRSAFSNFTARLGSM